MVDEYVRPLQPGYLRRLVAYRRQYFSAAFRAMTERYAELRMPLLIVWGDHDTWLPMDFGRRLHARVPKSRFEIIPDAGHLPHQERPDLTNPLLVEFLRKDER